MIRIALVVLLAGALAAAEPKAKKTAPAIKAAPVVKKSPAAKKSPATTSLAKRPASVGPSRNEYVSVLTDLTQLIRDSRRRALATVNRELVCLYWHIGRTIVEQQETAHWGDAAEKELHKIPFFVRGKARRNTERYASERGLATITLETLYEAKAHFSR